MRTKFRSILLQFTIPKSSSTSSSIQSPLINLQSQQVHRNFSSSSLISLHSKYSSFPSKQTHLISTALNDILSKSTTNNEIQTDKVFDTLITNLKRKSWDNRIAKVIRNCSKNELLDYMLYLFGRKEYVNEFWVLVEVMKSKGLGITKRVYSKAKGNFDKEGMVKDLGKLKELYVKRSEIESVCSKICMVIRENEWGENVRRELMGLTSDWCDELVKMVIEDLGLRRTRGFEWFDGDDVWDVKVHNEIKSYWNPKAALLVIESSGVHSKKALMFFRWVEEKFDFEHTEVSYNAILRVLSLGDCIDEFWHVVFDTKEAGYKMDMKTYDFVVKAFHKRGMFKDALHLYEWMVSCSTDPSALKDHSFQSMAEKFEDTNACLTDADFPFDSLVQLFCLKDRAEDAYKLLIGLNDKRKFKPLKGTFRMLITALLSHGKLDEILRLFWLMKKTRRYAPSTCMAAAFKGFLNAGMRREAKILLSYCPKRINRNPSVRLLFRTEDPEEASFRESLQQIQNERMSLYKKREVLRASRAAYVNHRF
ncbi:hypothetical protein ACHQM5_000420 [Ranunculus cassubicifolius]